MKKKTHSSANVKYIEMGKQYRYLFSLLQKTIRIDRNNKTQMRLQEAQCSYISTYIQCFDQLTAVETMLQKKIWNILLTPNFVNSQG